MTHIRRNRFLAVAFMLTAGSFSVPAQSNSLAHIEISGLNALVGSAFATAHFNVAKRVSFGPSLGFHPFYLLTPDNVLAAFDIGFDANIYLTGGMHDNSWVFNPYSYLSATYGYRVSQPSVHVGYNFGYRWVLPSRLIISLSLGIKSIYSHLETFAYTPGGRVSLGAVHSVVPIAPSLKFTLGFPI